MSSITFADHKLGGRITASCDAIAAGHLNRAAGILAELADELNVEATATGLLAIVDDADNIPTLDKLDPVEVKAELAKLATVSEPADLQMCARNVHSFGPSEPISGWRTCSTCGQVNVAPPENNGPIDMSVRQ